MLIYATRRLLAAIPILLAATIFTFLVVDLSGNPLEPLLVQQPPVPAETIQAETERLYLDRSMPERYWLWLTGLGQTNGDIGLLRGEWGPATNRAMDIGAEVAGRTLVTLRLVLAATLLAIGLAVVSGVISARRQYSKTDYSLTFVGFLALAMPTFWLASLVKETGVWANDTFGFQMFSTIGATSPGYDRMSPLEQVGDVAGHLMLPTVTLMLSGYAAISRYQRASMLEVLNSDYVRLARAKGLRDRVVMRRHALRTALIPLVTIATPLVATAVGGSIIIEFVFRWRGMGDFLLTSIRDADAFAVMAILLLVGFFVVAGNLVADLLYAVLDPRIRYA